MKNKLLVALSLSGIIFSTTLHADYSDYELKHAYWHPVMGVGGGTSSTTNLGSAQTFPITNPVTAGYYVYSPQIRTQTKGLIEVFFGAERPLSSNWILQGGLAYDQTASYRVNGSLVQGADYYTYQFKAITRQLLAQAKFMRLWNDKFHPYFLLGLGTSINSASNFATNIPSFPIATRTYQNNQYSSFAYRVGVGVDLDVVQNVRLGVAYRFADLGGVSLGAATINNISVPGKLSQSNLYANEVLIQVTYII